MVKKDAGAQPPARDGGEERTVAQPIVVEEEGASRARVTTTQTESNSNTPCPEKRLARKLRTGRRSTPNTTATPSLSTGALSSAFDTSISSFSEASQSVSAPGAASLQTTNRHVNRNDTCNSVIQTPDERLSIKLQTHRSIRLSNVSGVSWASGEDCRRRSTGADTVEEENEEEEEEQSTVVVSGSRTISPSAGEDTTTNDETDLERVDGSEMIAQEGEEGLPSVAYTNQALHISSYVYDSEHEQELPPPVVPNTLEAYTAEEVEYAKVVDDTAVACMALRTKRAMCVIIAFVLVVIVAVVAGVFAAQQKAGDVANQQSSLPIDKTPITQENIHIAVNYWIVDPKGAEKQYGHISTWDTSSITSLEALFYDYSNFNDDISAWNTSAVEIMKQLFSRATSFNGNISGWDTSKVRTMEGMFRDASSFNGDLSGWDTGNVERMNSCFKNAASFTGTLCWDLGSITTATQFENGFGACETSNIKTCHMFCSSGGSFDPSCATSEMIKAAQECPKARE